MWHCVINQILLFHCILDVLGYMILLFNNLNNRASKEMKPSAKLNQIWRLFDTQIYSSVELQFVVTIICEKLIKLIMTVHLLHANLCINLFF